MLKRAFDVVVATAVLLLTSPLFFLIAGIIKITSPGPILYRARRVGQYGELFTMLKFRTMVPDAEQKGGASSGNDDPRITRIGSLLRSCKLDELPQLINVLYGEMSLVGPRPNVQFDVDLYTPEEREEILSLRPGITDFASIEYSNEGEILAGHPDPDEGYNELIRPGKIALQRKYFREQSFLTDLKIIFLTAWTVIAKLIGFPRVRIEIPEELRAAPVGGQV